MNSHSEEDTRIAGELLGRKLGKGDLIALVGDLGSGKTVFVQGVAEALQAEERPCSPTFVLLREHKYPSGLLVHGDLYRLPQGMPPALGIADMLEDGAICCIEWADRLPEIPSYAIQVEICRTVDSDIRNISVNVPDNRKDEFAALLEEFEGRRELSDKGHKE